MWNEQKVSQTLAQMVFTQSPSTASNVNMKLHQPCIFKGSGGDIA